MADDLALNRERVLQNITQRQQELSAENLKAPEGALGSVAPILKGAAVFDVVSGQEGTVESVNQLRPRGVINVVVRLETGGLVVRGPGHLIVRRGV